MDLGMQETKAHSFEEEDDDVFYNELRRQVLQLTADDDDDDDVVMEDIVYHDAKVMIGPDARKQGPYSVPQPVCYDGWPGNKAAATTPAWIANLWRSGNGTGVFIPQGWGLQSRKKNRSKRKNDRGRTYRRVESRINI